jgi:hypothetical protein
MNKRTKIQSNNVNTSASFKKYWTAAAIGGAALTSLPLFESHNLKK